MSGDLKIQGVVEVSAEGVDQTFNRVGDAAGRMSNKIESSAEKASKAVDGIGSGANQNAEQFTRAEGKISASIKRATTNLEQLIVQYIGIKAGLQSGGHIHQKGYRGGKLFAAIGWLGFAARLPRGLHGRQLGDFAGFFVYDPSHAAKQRKADSANHHCEH